MFKRLLSSASALTVGQGIHLLIQFLMPPVFITAYGVHGYGEWLVLSASIAYLTFLDFGYQTYVINVLTVLHHQGESKKFHQIQSTALRLVLGVAFTVTLLLFGVFFLPISSALNLSVPQLDASLTVYFLALQIVFAIVFGQVNGTFRSIGKSHRAIMWANCQKLLYLVITITLALKHVPLWVIALGQTMTFVPSIVGTLVNLKVSHPTLMPTLRYWDKLWIKNSVRPSAFFGLFIVNNFIVFQAPIIILNQFLGASGVVMFTLARTLFSLVRQFIAIPQAAMAPEITRLEGTGERDQLARLYVLAESIVLTLILVGNVAIVSVAPLLMYVWMGRMDLFSLDVFLLIMIASALMSVKDFKLYFQYATNTHVRTGTVTFVGYMAMLVAAIPFTQLAGIAGFAGIWILTELFLILVIHPYNQHLLKGGRSISVFPSLKLVLVVMLIGGIALIIQPIFPPRQFAFQGVVAIVLTIILCGISYCLFDLKGSVRALSVQCRSSRKV